MRKAREDDTCHMQQYECEREVCQDLVHLLYEMGRTPLTRDARRAFDLCDDPRERPCAAVGCGE